jgi:hypothetical protein
MSDVRGVAPPDVAACPDYGKRIVTQCALILPRVNQFDHDVDRRDYTAIVVRSLQLAPRLPPWPRGAVRRRSQAWMGSPAMTNRAAGSQAAETVEHVTVIPFREHFGADLDHCTVDGPRADSNDH